MSDLPEEAVEGLPPELATALRDLSVLVPQDQRLFELIAAYRDAPSDTTSSQDYGPFIAAIRKQERERYREAVYQELRAYQDRSAECYIPDHLLIGLLDNVEATLEDSDA